MFRTLASAAAMVLGLVCVSGVSAGSIDYLSNQSADYVRTFSRNASTDLDAAVYNPAGTAFMTPGLHFGLSNQFVFKHYENDSNYNVSAYGISYDDSYKTDLPTWFLPNGSVVYNGGPWAIYLNLGVVAGGGTVQYNDGIPYMGLAAISNTLVKTAANGTATLVSFKDGNLTATSMYPEATLGASYAFTSMVSASAALRYVYAYKSFNGEANYSVTMPAVYGNTVVATSTAKVDVEQTAQGVGGIFGVDVKPITDVLLTARFETPTVLNFKTKVKNGENFNGYFVDGDTEREDLPGMIGLGASYTLFNALTLTTSWDLFLIGLSDSTVYENYDSLGWEGGFSAEYRFNEMVAASAGYMYDKVGGNSDTYSDFGFALDSHSLGAGVKLTFMKDLDVTLAASHIFYVTAKGQETTVGDVTYKKQTTILAIGATYKVF